jgi:hypothetical protein
MATYAIGDIQGCFTTLEHLLKHIHFNPLQDTLWFAGCWRTSRLERRHVQRHIECG